MEALAPTPDTRPVFILTIMVPYTLAVRTDSAEDAEHYVGASARPSTAVRLGTLQEEGSVAVEDVTDGFPDMACRLSTPRRCRGCGILVDELPGADLCPGCALGK